VSFTCPIPRKGLILHSGAVGDCLLTLPLAAFMKRACGLAQVHFMGRFEAAGFYLRRSCVDFVKPMESVPLHRLFEPQAVFAVDDPDRLITAFAGYAQIVSFLGAGHSDFEQNLLLTVHCSHSAEVTMLPMAPSGERPEHISEFYVRAFAESLGIDAGQSDVTAVWLTPTAEDQWAGRDRLAGVGVNADAAIAILHPGSGGRHKCWYYENFISAAEQLAARGVQPIFLLGPAEEDRLGATVQRRFEAAAPVLRGLTLTEVVQVLSQADVFIGNDSGVSHIAGAMGKKAVAIFGPTDPILYRPLGPAVTVFISKAEGFESPSVDDAAALFSQIDTLLGMRLCQGKISSPSCRAISRMGRV